jgi:hypothetical protein
MDKLWAEPTVNSALAKITRKYKIVISSGLEQKLTSVVPYSINPASTLDGSIHVPQPLVIHVRLQAEAVLF